MSFYHRLVVIIIKTGILRQFIIRVINFVSLLILIIAFLTTTLVMLRSNVSAVKYWMVHPSALSGTPKLSVLHITNTLFDINCYTVCKVTRLQLKELQNWTRFTHIFKDLLISGILTVFKIHWLNIIHSL